MAGENANTASLTTARPSSKSDLCRNTFIVTHSSLKVITWLVYSHNEAAKCFIYDHIWLTVNSTIYDTNYQQHEPKLQ